MKNALLLVVLAAACALTACNNSSAERSANHPAVHEEYENSGVSRDALPAENFSARDVVSAVNEAGGLVKLPKGVATAVIDDYIGRLSGMATAAPIVTDLRIVREEINSGFIDAGEVGAALNRLAINTRAAVPKDSPYQGLASVLSLTGKQLVGDKLED